jgi:hypothetical protein
LSRRIEKKVKALDRGGGSLKYPNRGTNYVFQDEEGNKYEWDTKSERLIGELKKGNWYRLRMTIVSKNKNLSGRVYYTIQRVRLLDKLGEAGI